MLRVNFPNHYDCKRPSVSARCSTSPKFTTALVVTHTLTGFFNLLSKDWFLALLSVFTFEPSFRKENRQLQTLVLVERTFCKLLISALVL